MILQSQLVTMIVNKLSIRLATRLYGFQYNHSRNLQIQASSLTTREVTKIANEREPFMNALPNIIDSLVTNSKFSESPDVSDWVRQLLNYTLAGGKYTRGMTTVFAYEAVEKPENITQESMRMARTLGWCVEMAQSYLQLLDDMMDGSSIRRGKPCWYTLPNVGMGGVNDSLIMHCSILETLKANFSKMPLYREMVDLYNETMLLTCSGQHLDYLTSEHRNRNDYSMFTKERYNSIARYKAAYYTFRLPILLGYLLANNLDTNLHKKMEGVCFDLGQLFQIQDDYIDCYGDEILTGKKGSDIQEGKCSWLAMQALKLSNDAQRAFFIENYADKDPAKVQNIKQLYEELKLRELYKEEETLLYESIVDKTNVLPSNYRKLFITSLVITYQRKK